MNFEQYKQFLEAFVESVNFTDSNTKAIFSSVVETELTYTNALIIYKDKDKRASNISTVALSIINSLYNKDYVTQDKYGIPTNVCMEINNGIASHLFSKIDTKMLSQLLMNYITLYESFKN